MGTGSQALIPFPIFISMLLLSSPDPTLVVCQSVAEKVCPDCWHLQKLHISDYYQMGILNYSLPNAILQLPLFWARAVDTWLWLLVTTLISTQYTSTEAGTCPSLYQFLLPHALHALPHFPPPLAPCYLRNREHMWHAAETHIQLSSVVILYLWLPVQRMASESCDQYCKKLLTMNQGGSM